MSMEKWINNYVSNEDKKKRDETYNKLSREEKNDLKKRKVKDLVVTKDVEKKESPPSKDFLSEILDFNTWLNNRNYIAGDVDKIGVWIKNLYHKLHSEYLNQPSEKIDNKDLINKYKEIPPTFLEEKIRLALNKKLKGMKGTSSDSYYIKKLKLLVQEKLKEAKYYEILREILES
ncbi:MAG: hypothetical protein ACFFKA_20750 [Candidatus Thorarchaeota archaeon]